MYELGRVPAVNPPPAVTLPLRTRCRSLLFVNALSVALLVNWGSLPSSKAWDFIVPAHGQVAIPKLLGASEITVVAAYIAAPPAADLQAVVYGSNTGWAPSSGPSA